MAKKRQLVAGREWNVELVEGGKELFRMMCIDASKKMADGTMLLGGMGWIRCWSTLETGMKHSLKRRALRSLGERLIKKNMCKTCMDCWCAKVWDPYIKGNWIVNTIISTRSRFLSAVIDCWDLIELDS